MKPTTIWKRLNRAHMFQVVLLVMVIAMAWLVESYRSSAARRLERLSQTRDHVYDDFTLMGEEVRDLLLNPGAGIEKQRRFKGERDLRLDLDYLKMSYPDYADLDTAARQVRIFAFGQLAGFYSRVLETGATNNSAAIALYASGYPALASQGGKVLEDLSKQVEETMKRERMVTLRLSIVGITCIFLVALACGALGRLQSSAIAEPLGRLVETLERMRRGDFTQRLTSNQKDEFGVLSEGLNRLADDLCQLVGQVQRSGVQVSRGSTEIAATAREQQATAREIATTTAEIGATSKEISATSKELVKTMNEVNQVSEETAKLAGSGQTAIARMEGTMRQIIDASGAIAAKLAVLSEKTTNINSVVTTITKVADQTNLLSLNAAIEAEKAGEYGLGFAVVAMEIRRLADQTAVATYDIERMVKEMHSAVTAGVMGMDKFSEEVRRGVEEVRQVSTHLAQIIHQVQTLTPRFQMVNEGMHAQATGAQQISETLTQLSEAAQQTAESLRQSNVAIEQLNDTACGLQASVARFKLGPPTAVGSVLAPVAGAD